MLANTLQTQNCSSSSFSLQDSELAAAAAAAPLPSCSLTISQLSQLFSTILPAKVPDPPAAQQFLGAITNVFCSPLLNVPWVLKQPLCSLYVSLVPAGLANFIPISLLFNTRQVLSN